MEPLSATRTVEEAADERNIFVRSGSLCNPGGVATYLNWSPPEMRAAYAAGHRCTNPTQVMMGKPTGVVRVSLGAMSTASDVRTLLRFLEEVYLEREGQPRAAVAQATQMARTVQLPAAARPASPVTPVSPGALPPIATSGLPLLSSQTATTATSGQENAIDSGISIEPVERPRFIPADYIKYRKPWEEEMRKAQYANVGMEIKIREVDDANSFNRNGTPSVKARKFGRSVVNLLRNKQHHQEANNARYVTPPILCPN